MDNTIMSTTPTTTATEAPASTPAATDAPKVAAPKAPVEVIKASINLGNERVVFANTPHRMHPDVAALEIPTQTSKEFQRLLADVQKQGRIINPIKLAKDLDGQEYVVDGWNRQHIADDLELVRGKGYKVEYVAWNDAVSIALSESLRRNLDEGQTASLAMKVLEREKELAKQRQGANARIQNVLNGNNAPKILEVPYARLANGGDIAASYSADSIQVTGKLANSKLRGIFEFEGAMYAATDGSIGQRMQCHRIVTLQEYRENGAEPTTYAARMNEIAANPGLGLDGVLCEVRIKEGDTEKKVVRVMQGPVVIFAPAESQGSAADAGGAEGDDKKKGKKKPEKASEAAARQTGMSARQIEMLAAVKEEDPEAFARIEKKENQPGTGIPETVNSAYQRLRQSRAEKDPATKLDKDGYPKIGSIGIDEFVENHPLYANLKNNKVFIADVRGYYLMVNAIESAQRQAAQAGIRWNGSTSRFAVSVNAICNTPHPYSWRGLPASEENSAKGGYTYAYLKPELPETQEVPKANANPKPPTKAEGDAKPAEAGETATEAPAEAAPATPAE